MLVLVNIIVPARIIPVIVWSSEILCRAFCVLIMYNFTCNCMGLTFVKRAVIAIFIEIPCALIDYTRNLQIWVSIVPDVLHTPSLLNLILILYVFAFMLCFFLRHYPVNLILYNFCEIKIYRCIYFQLFALVHIQRLLLHVSTLTYDRLQKVQVTQRSYEAKI